MKEFNGDCFEPLKSIEKIIIYKNVGLNPNVLSFIKPSANISDYDKKQLKQYGSVS